MGKRLPDTNIDIGENCVACLIENGGYFVSGQQPKFLYLTFSAIQHVTSYECQTHPYPPNGHIFTLEQQPGNPCTYIYDRDPWFIEIKFGPSGIPNRTVRLQSTGAMIYFDSLSSAENQCEFNHSNLYTGPVVGCCGFGGYSTISFRRELLVIAESLGIPLSKTTFAESFSVDADHSVIKFCNKKDGTNIKIKILHP